MAEGTELTETNETTTESADEITKLLLDIQGQLANLTEIVDKLKPVEEAAAETTEEETTEETTEETAAEEPTEEELNEIDRLLQSE